jgi:hypothetical protein
MMGKVSEVVMAIMVMGSWHVAAEKQDDVIFPYSWDLPHTR